MQQADVSRSAEAVPAHRRRSARRTQGGALRLALALALNLILALAATASAAHQAPAIVRHISLRDGSSGATLTLALSAPVAAHVFRLAHPARLVIDLSHTRRRAALPMAPPDGLVTGVRSGRRPNEQLRLVVQLQGRTRYRLRWSAATAGAQLRIDLGSALLVTREDPGAPPAGAARGTEAIAAAHVPAAEREVIVAVDPGHGGVDPGATGPDGLHEKDVTLAIARLLAARIDAAPGMHAVLTRTGDYFVPLRERMQLARAAHADLFISIHADSVRDPLVSGASVYILSERGASSEAARQLADEENAADLKGGISLAAQAPDLRSVLLNLSQDASMAQSGEAAEDVLHSLDRVGPLRKNDVQHAAFVVLKSPDVPSMLVETAYISNPADERRLRDPRQRRRLADAIFGGIAAYFRQNPPQGSLFARAHEVASSPSS